MSETQGQGGAILNSSSIVPIIVALIGAIATIIAIIIKDTKYPEKWVKWICIAVGIFILIGSIFVLWINKGYIYLNAQPIISLKKNNSGGIYVKLGDMKKCNDLSPRGTNDPMSETLLHERLKFSDPEKFDDLDNALKKAKENGAKVMLKVKKSDCERHNAPEILSVKVIK